MLTDKQIQNFQDLYEKQFGQPITKAEATRSGIKLVEFMRLLILHNAKEPIKNK